MTFCCVYIVMFLCPRVSIHWFVQHASRGDFSFSFKSAPLPRLSLIFRFARVFTGFALSSSFWMFSVHDCRLAEVFVFFFVFSFSIRSLVIFRRWFSLQSAMSWVEWLTLLTPLKGISWERIVWSRPLGQTVWLIANYHDKDFYNCFLANVIILLD